MSIGRDRHRSLRRFWRKPTPVRSWGLARQTVASVHRVFRLLVLAKRRGAAEETESLSTILRSHWDAAESSLVDVAVRYNTEFARSLESSPPIPTVSDAR